MLKKTGTIWLTVVLLMTISRPAAAIDLYWYLASALNKPGQEIVNVFNRGDHSFTVILISGGSGHLLSRLSTARKGDLYTPASTSYVSRVESLGLLKAQRPFMAQTPVFGLSVSGREKVKSWSDLTKSGIRIGLGNPKTMALGLAFQQIKERMEPEQATQILLNKVVEGMSVSQLINYLKADIVDAVIVFDSTAIANGLAYIEIPARYNHQEVAPLIRLTSETNEKNTSVFIDFIMANIAIFEKHGFNPAFEQD